MSFEGGGVHHFLLMYDRWVLPAVNRVLLIKAWLVATESGTHNKMKTIERKSMKKQRTESRLILQRGPVEK